MNLNRWFYAPDEPPAGGTPPAPTAPPAGQAPASGAAPTATPPAGAPPASPPPPANEWDQMFPGVKPTDVVTAMRNMKAKIDELQRAPQPLAAAAPPTPPKTVTDLMFENPEAALDQYFGQRLAPLVTEFHNHASTVTREMVANKVNEKGKPMYPHFSRFRGEIEQFMERVQPELRTKPESWASAYNFVVGQNMDKLIEEARMSGMPAVESGGGTPAPQASGKITLTPEQKMIAAKLNMTEEEYAEFI